MKQKTKDIIRALLLGLLCTLALSAVITVADTETACTDLMIGMQYETTGLDLDAAPGLLVGLVKLHQNFPLDAWVWGPAVAGLAALLYWVRRQRTAKPRCAELVLSIVFGVAEVLGLSICKLGSWAFVFKNPYQVFVGAVCMAGYGVLFYHAVWGLYALLGRPGGAEAEPENRFARRFARAPGLHVVAAHRRGMAALGGRVLARVGGLGLLGADLPGHRQAGNDRPPYGAVHLAARLAVPAGPRPGQ